MLPRLAIPTYQRPEMIRKKTLAFLEQAGYPADRIYLFVANEQEKELYTWDNIVVGVPGLVHQRNFITDFFDEGEIIVCMDDDVESIDCINNHFLGLVEYAVRLINIGEGGLFGIRPNTDGRLYTYKTTSHLAFIIGSFNIRRNHRSIRLTQPQKHDYEMTMLYFLRYGKVYRYNGAGVKTKYMKNAGGLMDEQRVANMQECVDTLCERYPGMCISKPKHTPDLLLNWRFVQ